MRILYKIMLIIKYKFGISSTNINADAHRANKNSSNFENNNNKHIWYKKINSTNNIDTHWTMNNTQKFVWTSSNKNSVIEYENNKKK